MISVKPGLCDVSLENPYFNVYVFQHSFSIMSNQNKRSENSGGSECKIWPENLV